MDRHRPRSYIVPAALKHAPTSLWRVTMKKLSQKELLKMLHGSKRLVLKAPKVIKSPKSYTRKTKHKRGFSENPLIFLLKRIPEKPIRYSDYVSNIKGHYARIFYNYDVCAFTVCGGPRPACKHYTT